MKYSILSKYDEMYQIICHSEIVHREKSFKNFDLNSILDESAWNEFDWNEKDIRRRYILFFLSVNTDNRENRINCSTLFTSLLNISVQHLQSKVNLKS